MPKQPKLKGEKTKKFNKMLRFTSLSSEMIGAILIPSLIGYWMDGYFQTDKPFFTLVFSLFGVFASMVLLYKGLNKE